MPATILVVDDHEAVRWGLREWLEMAFPGCRVIEANSGEEAIVLTINESPRVVLMDINLPGMNGIEATRRSTPSGTTCRADTRPFVTRCRWQ